MTHTVIIWTLHFPLLWTLSWVTKCAERLQWPAGLHINLNMNLRWKPEITRRCITPRWLVMGLKHGWNRDRECCRMRLRSRGWVKGIWVFFLKKINAVYLHLPAKWLGGRKPLGWGAGPYGDGAGWPEPTQQQSMSLLHLSPVSLFL